MESHLGLYGKQLIKTAYMTLFFNFLIVLHEFNASNLSIYNVTQSISLNTLPNVIF